MPASPVVHTYPLADAVTAASAVLPHVSKDDVTPVITTALVSCDAWVATDRFTVGRYAITRPHEGPLADIAENPNRIMVPREAVEWVAKIALKKLRQWPAAGYALTISQDMEELEGGHLREGDVTVSIVLGGKVERSQSFEPVRGNFPPVERIIENWKPATDVAVQSLGPVQLEKITAFAKRAYPEMPVLMEPGHSESDKPGPMRVTIGSLVALLQPNMALK